MKKRTTWIKKTMAILLTGVLVFTACGCGNSTESTGAENSGNATAQISSEADDSKNYRDTINIGVNQESPTLDLMKTGTLVARHIANGTIYEKLFTLNANGEPVPELCESYEANEDNSEYTFHIRQGILFHDGSEMTADDVVASMNRWIENFSTAKTLCGDSRFEKIDDSTVKITLTNPCATFLTAISGGTQQAIITTVEACADENENGYMKQYIGTGPYKFSEWELNQYITLEKFEDYTPYGDENTALDGLAGYKHAYTDKLIYWYVPEDATRLAGLQTGQYDIILNVSSDNYDVISNMDGFKTDKAQDGIAVMVCNKKEGIMSNEKMRQAVNAALNCEELLTAGYGNFFSLGNSYMDETQGAWVTDAGSENYNVNDPEKAKLILEDAGYNGETVRVLVPNQGAFPKIAEIFRQEMEKIGVTVETNVVDFATSTELSGQSDQWDLWIISFSSVPLPSQKTFLSPNYKGWSTDDTLTGYLTDFNNAASTEGAYSTWEEMQAYAQNEYIPVLMLGHYESAIAYSEKLTGVQYYMGAYYWNARVEE